MNSLVSFSLRVPRRAVGRQPPDQNRARRTTAMVPRHRPCAGGFQASALLSTLSRWSLNGRAGRINGGVDGWQQQWLHSAMSNPPVAFVLKVVFVNVI